MKKLFGYIAILMVILSLVACAAPTPTAAPEAPAAPAAEAATAAPAAEAAAPTAEAAAPAAEAGAKGKVMGIVMPNADHGFTGESIKHAEAFAKELSAKEGFTYKFLTAGETSEQNNQIDTLINDKVDVIVMWPINGDELRSAAQKVMDSKIPLVIYDRLITDFEPTVEFMGDNVTIGKMTGEYFNNYFKKEIDAGETINILEFKGDLSTVPTQRSDGFKSTAAKNFNIVQAFTTDWQRAKAMEQMETFFNTSSQADIESIKAIFTHDDEVVLGVLDAIAAYKGPAKLDIRLVSGVGARKENLDVFPEFKEKYNIDQVTYAFSPAMIREAVQLGADILNGKTPSGLILGPTVEVDNSNAEEFRNNEVYKIRYSLDN
ncbi:MAG: substrate-binding domain-containing protein [Anaerolineae bacterium]|nr:substrate-binding domain-containing protein [Anaerolineae bacterium]